MSSVISPYRYRALLPRPDSFRLLRLHPSKDESAPIRCRLFNYSLQESGRRSHPYDALSYVWGKSEKSRSIFIEKHALPVTPNLHDALLRLRHRSIERIIWVDAVSIDQGNIQEKEQQIQFMPKIYGQANRVVVWLGEAADNSSQALEEIRIAGGKISPHSLNKETTQQAVLALLHRPWFRRIWILQEVAAARHVLVMCGPIEIDGYAFCLGIDSLKEFYEAYADLQSLIRSVTYLIRGTIFRPNYAGSGPGSVSKDICSLGELVDMYHTHEATERHDKVYALLGMSSDDTSKASLSPDYKVPWKHLFERLTRFLLCEQTFVEASSEKEIAVIKSKGCIIGKVFSVQSNITGNGRQGVEVILKNIPTRSGSIGERSSHWTLQVSAKPIKIGDIICLLQGTTKPTIIRFCEDHWAIILIAVSPPQTIRMGGECVEWSKFIELAKLLPNRNLQLVWDWKNSPGKSQGLGKYKKSEGYLDKETTLLNFALLLGDAGMYKKAEERFREAMKRYETAFKEGHLHNTDAHQLSLGNGADLDLMNSQYSRPPLSWAAEKGYEAVVKLLLSTGEVDVNLKDIDGWTPLSRAAKGGYLAVVERLLQEKAEVNATAAKYYGRTALQAAAGGGHLAIVERLLQEKAEVNAAAVYFDGRTALQAAAGGGHLLVVERLLQEKAEVNTAVEAYYGRTALQEAAGGGHLAVVERLLQEKADVNALAAKYGGRTALQAAAGGGHLAVVERLLQEKAEVNALAAKYGGRTALQAAAEGGHLAIVERLLQEGAEANEAAVKDGGRTALQAAAGGGHFAVLERLLQKTAEVNAAAAKYYGRTALQAAAGGGHLLVVERLLQEKAEVNAAAVAYYGRTALQAAAGGGHLAIVERLLQEKAEVNALAAKYDGRTALQAAAGGGHLAVVKRLLQEKAGVNAAAVKDGGRTALQAAAGGGHLDVVELLIQEKAEVNTAAAAYYGRTALQASAEGGHLAVVERLLQEGAEVNAAAKEGGKTALQAAVEGGHLAVLERLRHAGAAK